MNLPPLIARMEAFPGVLARLCEPLTPVEYRFKPPSGAWSILEIVCHLVDEEMRDFRARVDSTLHDPSKAWEPIDPEGWAVADHYNQRELEEQLARFAEERAESVSWLRRHINPDWTLAYEHPEIGTLRAGDLMASWGAHDTLHLRQIAKRLYELAARDTEGFSAEYAGGW